MNGRNLFLIILSIFVKINYGNSQENLSESKYFYTEIDPRIIEVYNSQLEELKKTPLILQTITEIVQKRTEIIYEPYRDYEKIDKLSNYPLFNEYNTNLERDTDINPYTFNVLKYDLPFFPKLPTKYRIDGSDFVLVILPLNFKN